MCAEQNAVLRRLQDKLKKYRYMVLVLQQDNRSLQTAFGALLAQNQNGPQSAEAQAGRAALARSIADMRAVNNDIARLLTEANPDADPSQARQSPLSSPQPPRRGVQGPPSTPSRDAAWSEERAVLLARVAEAERQARTAAAQAASAMHEMSMAQERAGRAEWALQAAEHNAQAHARGVIEMHAGEHSALQTEADELRAANSEAKVLLEAAQHQVELAEARMAAARDKIAEAERRAAHEAATRAALEKQFEETREALEGRVVAAEHQASQLSHDLLACRRDLAHAADHAAALDASTASRELSHTAVHAQLQAQQALFEQERAALIAALQAEKEREIGQLSDAVAACEARFGECEAQLQLYRDRHLADQQAQADLRRAMEENINSWAIEREELWAAREAAIRAEDNAQSEIAELQQRLLAALAEHDESARTLTSQMAAEREEHSRAAADQQARMHTEHRAAIRATEQDLEARIAELQQECDQSHARIQESEARAAELQREVERAHEQADDAERRVELTRAQLDTARRNTADITADRDRLAARLRTLEAQIAQTSEEHAIASSTWASERASLAAQLALAEESARTGEQRHASLSAAEAAARTAQAEIKAALVAARAQLEEKTREAESTKASHKRELEASRAEIARLQEHLAAVKASAEAEARDAEERHLDERTALQAEADEQRTMNVEVRELLDSTQQHVALIEARMAKAGDTLAAAEARAAAAQGQVEALSSELDRLRVELSTSATNQTQVVTSLEEQMSDIRAERDAAAAALASLEDQHRARDRELAQIAEEESQLFVKLTRAEHESLLQTQADLTDQLTTATTRNQSLQRDLDAALAARAALDRELARLAEEDTQYVRMSKADHEQLLQAQRDLATQIAAASDADAATRAELAAALAGRAAAERQVSDAVQQHRTALMAWQEETASLRTALDHERAVHADTAAALQQERAAAVLARAAADAATIADEAARTRALAQQQAVQHELASRAEQWSAERAFLISSHEAALRAKDGEIAALQADMASGPANMQALQAQLAAEIVQHKECVKALNKARADAAETAAGLSACRAQLGVANTETQQQRTLAMQLRADKIALEARIAAYEEKRRQSMDNSDDQAGKLQLARTTVVLQQTEARLAAADKQIAELRTANASLKGRVRLLQAQLHTNSSAAKLLDVRQGDLKSRLELLESRMFNLADNQGDVEAQEERLELLSMRQQETTRLHSLVNASLDHVINGGRAGVLDESLVDEASGRGALP